MSTPLPLQATSSPPPPSPSHLTGLAAQQRRRAAQHRARGAALFSPKKSVEHSPPALLSPTHSSSPQQQRTHKEAAVVVQHAHRQRHAQAQLSWSEESRSSFDACISNEQHPLHRADLIDLSPTKAEHPQAHPAQHTLEPPPPPTAPTTDPAQHQLHTHGFLEAWICIRQSQQGGPAEVYEHSSPLDSETWDVLGRRQQRPLKLMTVHERSFNSCTDLRGEWANFRVRLSRNFSAFEETTMFPNNVQLLLTRPPPPSLSSSAHNNSSYLHTHTNTNDSSTLSPSTHDHPFSQPNPTNNNSSSTTTHNSTPRKSTPISSSTPSQHTTTAPSIFLQALSHPHSTTHAHATQGVEQQQNYQQQHDRHQQQHVHYQQSDPLSSNSSSDSDTAIILRRCHNARSLADLVQLLADPTETGILAHLANASRLLSYKPRRIWGCLKARWGTQALHGLGFTPRRVHSLLQQGDIFETHLTDELWALHHYRADAEQAAVVPAAAFLSDEQWLPYHYHDAEQGNNVVPAASLAAVSAGVEGQSYEGKDVRSESREGERMSRECDELSREDVKSSEDHKWRVVRELQATTPGLVWGGDQLSS